MTILLAFFLDVGGPEHHLESDESCTEEQELLVKIRSQSNAPSRRFEVLPLYPYRRFPAIAPLLIQHHSNRPDITAAINLRI